MNPRKPIINQKNKKSITAKPNQKQICTIRSVN